MLQLDNIQTADDYTIANQISDPQADLLELAVAGADVYVRFRPADPERHNTLDWAGELRVPAPAHAIYQGIAGVEVRSATGAPATVTATLFQPDDPRPSSASSTVVSVTQGVSMIQHNGVAVGLEPVLDFEDAGAAFTVTDDGPNKRITVEALLPDATVQPVSSFAIDAAGEAVTPPASECLCCLIVVNSDVAFTITNPTGAPAINSAQLLLIDISNRTSAVGPITWGSQYILGDFYQAPLQGEHWIGLFAWVPIGGGKWVCLTAANNAH